MKALLRLLTIPLRPWPSVVTCAGLIFVGSSVPLPRGPKVDLPVEPDKIVHAVAYALLAGLTVRAAWPPKRRLVRLDTVVAAAVLGAIGYGALLEGWQTVLGGRSAALGDVTANTLGAAAGGLVALWACRARRSRTRDTMERADHGEEGRSEAD